jgi:galactokinase
MTADPTQSESESQSDRAPGDTPQGDIWPRASEIPPAEARAQSVIDAFHKHFDGPPAYLAAAPGRVNLIGEHTDYNDGFVLPVALHRDICVALRPRNDDTVRVYSLEYGEWFAFKLSQPEYNQRLLWSNYVQGMAWSLQELGLRLRGMDALISGNVPRGSGLSSSAALEVAVAKALLAAAELEDAIDDVALAQAAQRAENQFVGVNCGIMDQFISVLGQKSHALLIDCRSLEYELIPFPDKAALVIGNTKASRSLAGSAYNERRQQCEEGVAILQQSLPQVRALRDVTPEQLEAHQDALSPVVYRRCRHVVSENERVHKTVAALRRDNLLAVGLYMESSHASLRDDYEVSSAALDAMVEAMVSAPGCFGARLTGAGFGGCAVALVQPGKEQAVADAIFERYPKATNIWPEVYTSQPGPGASITRLPLEP